jgi:hypothetical protein
MRLLEIKFGQLVDRTNTPVDHVTNNDVIYFADWYSRVWLEHTISKLGTPQLVVCDVEASLAPQPVPLIFLPDLSAGLKSRYLPDMLAVIDLDSTKVNTTSCFNFSVNKKRHDRFMLLKLIQWFQLSSYQYTWSGSGDIVDMQPVLTEMQALPACPEWYNSKFLTHMLSPVTGLEPRWHTLEDNIGQDRHHQTRFTGLSGDQWATFKRSIIETTAVSIVCDSSTNLEPNFAITERTLYYIAGLNFAIFAGHYGQAEQMERMGIDTFADVIDHSYQWRPTLMERMYHAIHDNLKILTDLEYAQQQRLHLMQRLIQNRTYMFGAGFSQWVDQQYQLLPLDLVAAFRQLSQPVGR